MSQENQVKRRNCRFCASLSGRQGEERKVPSFHLTHLIHLIDKPYFNAASFCSGLSVNESRESVKRRNCRFCASLGGRQGEERKIPSFHLTHLIHLIEKPCFNAASFCSGLPINESRESSETANVALRARFFTDGCDSGGEGERTGRERGCLLQHVQTTRCFPQCLLPRCAAEDRTAGR